MAHSCQLKRFFAVHMHLNEPRLPLAFSSNAVHLEAADGQAAISYMANDCIVQPRNNVCACTALQDRVHDIPPELSAVFFR